MPKAAAVTSEDVEAEAILELTVFLSGDGARRRGPSSAFFLPSKPKPFAVAWMDPTAKRSTKGLLPGDRGSKIHFPLSSGDLGDPGAAVTIQILHPRFPFRHGSGGGGGAIVEGAAAVPLSALPATAGRTLTLPLCSPSGRPRGSVCISARVFWCLGSPPPQQSVPSEEYNDWVPEAATAPLMEPNSPKTRRENDHKNGAWGSLLVGLACGTLAVVLIGAAGLSEG